MPAFHPTDSKLNDPDSDEFEFGINWYLADEIRFNAMRWRCSA